MKLIDNLTLTENHRSIFLSLITKSTQIMIASPFLSQELDVFLEKLGCSNVKDIVLLTTLKENDVDQIYKMKSIIALKSFANKNGIKLGIKINNRLHGKVYLFVNNKNIFRGIVTSANFTENGFIKNCEWGIEIDNKSSLNDLEKNVFMTSMNTTLTEEALNKIILHYQNYISQNRDVEKINIKKIDLSLMKDIGLQDRPIIFKNITYWLKPIGVTGNPVKEGEKYNDDPERLEFSQKKPSGVHKDDIIIAYGVGTGRILSIYQVLSTEPDYASREEIEEEEWRERWPWSVEGKNLSKKYGSIWWKMDLYITSLAKKFVHDLKMPVTKAGSNTLGALNFGKDRVKLSPEFGNYLVNLIFDIESNLA
jgi:HKD family nuclease